VDIKPIKTKANYRAALKAIESRAGRSNAAGAPSSDILLIEGKADLATQVQMLC
jgi:hypothetical protein